MGVKTYKNQLETVEVNLVTEVGKKLFFKSRTRFYK